MPVPGSRTRPSAVADIQEESESTSNSTNPWFNAPSRGTNANLAPATAMVSSGRTTMASGVPPTLDESTSANVGSYRPSSVNRSTARRVANPNVPDGVNDPATTRLPSL